MYLHVFVCVFLIFSCIRIFKFYFISQNNVYNFFDIYIFCISYTFKIIISFCLFVCLHSFICLYDYLYLKLYKAQFNHLNNNKDL